MSGFDALIMCLMAPAKILPKTLNIINKRKEENGRKMTESKIQR